MRKLEEEKSLLKKLNLLSYDFIVNTVSFFAVISLFFLYLRN